MKTIEEKIVECSKVHPDHTLAFQYMIEMLFQFRYSYGKKEVPKDRLDSIESSLETLLVTMDKHPVNDELDSLNRYIEVNQQMVSILKAIADGTVPKELKEKKVKPQPIIPVALKNQPKKAKKNLKLN